MKTNTNLSKNLLSTLFIKHIKVVGALVKPKWHHHKFVVTIPYSEGYFVDIFIPNLGLDGSPILGRSLRIWMHLPIGRTSHRFLVRGTCSLWLPY
jgi:hypothetical protein